MAAPRRRPRHKQEKGRHPPGSAHPTQSYGKPITSLFSGPWPRPSFPFSSSSSSFHARHPHGPRSLAFMRSRRALPAMPSRFVYERRAPLSREFRVTAKDFSLLCDSAGVIPVASEDCQPFALHAHFHVVIILGAVRLPRDVGQRVLVARFF